MPQNTNDVRERLEGDLEKARRSIFEDCGWPEESRYRKDECMERIKKLGDKFLDTGKVPKV